MLLIESSNQFQIYFLTIEKFIRNSEFLQFIHATFLVPLRYSYCRTYIRHIIYFGWKSFFFLTNQIFFLRPKQIIRSKQIIWILGRLKKCIVYELLISELVRGSGEQNIYFHFDSTKINDISNKEVQVVNFKEENQWSLKMYAYVPLWSLSQIESTKCCQSAPVKYTGYSSLFICWIF